MSIVDSCQHWRLELDALGNTLFLAGDQQFVAATSVAELEAEYCQRQLQAIDGLRNVSRRCFMPFMRQVSGLVTFGFRKNIRRVCSDELLKQQMVDKFTCFRNESKKQLLDSTMSSLISQLEYIRNSVANASHLLPQACCAYSTYHMVSLARSTLHSVPKIDYSRLHFCRRSTRCSTGLARAIQASSTLYA